MNEEQIKKMIADDFDNFINERLDSAIIFKYIDNLEKENLKLKEVIDKAIDEIETGYFIDGDEEYSYLETWFGVETLLNILKEVE